jgi:hypothetical protein
VFGNPGSEMTLAGSDAVSLAALVSPPPLTVATLVTVFAELESTVTVTAIGGYDKPAASTSERVHETVWPDCAGQVHPDPAAAVGVSPAGGTSVTVTVPLLGPPPGWSR